MSNNKKYWKGVEELNESPSFQESRNKEFNEYLPAEDFLSDGSLLENSNTSRRDFLKYLGFGVTAASLAACETPVTKVIPYVVKTEKTSPGVANYFATNYSDGYDYCDIVVKTREGRPIRIDANKKSPFSIGGISARVNASVLSLYDGKRLKAPQVEGVEVTWDAFYEGLKGELAAIDNAGGKIRILSNSLHSPSALRLIGELKVKYPKADIKHIAYDSVSFTGTLEANKEVFNVALMPSYTIEEAKSIVSFGADFICNYPSGTQIGHQYIKGRNPEKSWMSKHFQFESSFSLTGTNADVRVPIKPSEQGKAILALYNYLAAKLGQPTYGSVKLAFDDKIKEAGDHLLANKGESIVFAGKNDKNIQLLAIAINRLLGNYGSTLHINKPLNLRQGVDSELETLIEEMKSGSVGALLMADVNPSYNLPASYGFDSALEKVKTSVLFAGRKSVTSDKVKYLGASSHFLESWRDVNPKKGFYGVSQPAITKLFNTNQFEECLLALTDSKLSYHDYIKANWKENIHSTLNEAVFFDDFWIDTLHLGFFEKKAIEEANEMSEGEVNLAAAASELSKIQSADWELEFYEKVGIGDGTQAHNPWLQELPDPISKMTWDNYLAMNPADAKASGFATEYGEQKNADTVNLSVNGITFENVPVIAQPGQARGTVSIALGYGQTIGKKDEIVGINFYPAYNRKGYFVPSISFEATGNDYQVATTQTHQTVMGRTSVVRETTYDTFKGGVKDDYNPAHILATHDGPKNVNDIDLWAQHPVKNVGHHWGMSIDLNACTGCAACVTACNAENNVPVVGKDEVRRSREMHWMRIDRYFSSAEERVDKRDRSYGEMEIPEDNPMVVHQPMMCQHCNHAPCETVCPVAATTHSNEGLNQMTYNRCIGTRYCANNCPYKVRRFNWFSYQNYDKFAAFNPSQDDLGRMVLNPDVTVRARGVMEKCSMCVQMIQETKLKAKKEGRPVADEDFETACSTACSSDAIIFGDLNDLKSKVRERVDNSRAYRVIEEVGTQANVYYQVKVRNT